MALRNRLWVMLLIAGLTLLTGIVGYELIEGWGFLDAAYMTVTTLSTIGYGEIHRLSNPGRVFTMFLILCGITNVSYGAVALSTLLADGELLRLLRRRRMDKAIAKLQNHLITCGAGRTGSHLVEELLHIGRPVVVIDSHPENLRKFHSRDALVEHCGAAAARCQVFYLEGDASSEQTLLEAGIERAEGVFCALSTDKDNLIAVLTVRGLNNRIRIISKCEDDESERKLLRAGADRVVSPTRIGGLRMASEMVRPTVVSFLDVMVRDGQGYRFEEIQIQDHSPFIGQPLSQCPLRDEPDVRLVAVATKREGYWYNPSDEMLLTSGQRLVVIGRSEQVERLRRAVNGGQGDPVQPTS